MDDRIGPFGQGWTHCYDIRITEENPVTNQTDDSLNYADRTDFFGGRHKYHRDADGLYTPPPYLFDELDSDYDKFLVSGPIKALDDSQHSMDGTTKHFNSYGSAERVCDYIEDRYGNRTNLTYSQVTIGANVQNLLQTLTDPSSRQIVFIWTNLGTTQSPAYRITSAQGPAYSVAYAYNSDLNLQSVTLDPGDVNQGHANRATTFGYTSVTGSNGMETGLLNSVSDSLAHSVSYSYTITCPNSSGGTGPTPTNTAWVSSIVEPAGEDPVTHLQRTVTYFVQTGSNGFPVNLNESYTQFGTGAAPGAADNDLTCVLTSDLQLRKLGYWTGATPPVMLVHHSKYDSANNINETREPLMSTVSGTWRVDKYTFGPHGNQLTHMVDGFSGTDTTDYYDGSQYFQKKSVTDSLGHISTFGVGDKNGADPSNTNLTPATGNKGSVLWVRDAGYNVSTSPSYQKQFVYSYNNSGQKVQETNLNNVVTNYSYGDQWGNLTQVVQDPHVTQGDSHLARTTQMVYDAAGRVLQSTDPKNQTSNFNYSSLGQPTSAVFPATGSTPSETISYGYGANGRTESVTDNRGTTSMAYEAGSERVKSVTDPVTGAVSYSYLANGARLSLSLPGGGTWNYGYSLVGSIPIDKFLLKDDPNSLSPALHTITDDQGRRVEYEFRDNFGQTSFSGWTPTGHPHFVKSNQIFDTAPVPNLLSYCQTEYIYESGPNSNAQTGTPCSRFVLNGIKNTWNWKDANAVWQQKLLVQNQYTYDLSGQRLTNMIGSLDGNGNPVNRTEVYSYDEINRLKTVDYGDNQTQGYSFDPMGNRLQKQDSASGTENYSFNAVNMLLTRAGNSYTNDINGNTLTGGGRTNTWDSQNRLVTCINGTNTSSFMYAADGIRHQSTVNGTATDFVLDATMFVRERRNGTNIATYLAGLRGPEYRRDDTNGTIRWYLSDGLGSVLGEVDPNGTVTSSRKYDVYGAVRGGSNPAGTSSHKFVGGLGHPSEDNTGLIYMRARYYDPAIGRFISEDPDRDGMNSFSYANNNPVNSMDPSGKWILQAIVVACVMWLLQLILGEHIKAGMRELTGDYAYVKALMKWLKKICRIGQAAGSAEIAKGAGDKVLAPIDDSEAIEALADIEMKGGMTTKINSAFGSEAIDIVLELIEEAIEDGHISM